MTAANLLSVNERVAAALNCAPVGADCNDTAGAECFRFIDNENRFELFTLSGRKALDLKRGGDTYETVGKAPHEGFDGIALCRNGVVYNRIYYDGTVPIRVGEAAANEAPITAAGLPSALDFDDIPLQMRNAKRWLLWKSEIKSNLSKKPTKVPYYVNGTKRHGTLDSAADLAQFATFAEVLSALGTGLYSGLGFALGPDGTGNHWQGIDLDDLPGRPALEHIAANLPSYTESSPSGKGKHAIGYGRPFATLGSNSTGIEAYAGARYFTVTGDCAGLHPLCDLADFVERELEPVHTGAKPGQANLLPYGKIEIVDSRIVRDLRSALAHMRADDRALWVRMGHALKTLGDVGRGLWLDWSQTSTKYDPADASGTWDSLKPSSTDHKAVFAEAQRQGWVNPMSNAAAGSEKAPEHQTPSHAANSANIAGLELFDHIVDLAEMVSADSEHPHVVASLLPQGEVTLLTGHGGAGKSYIALLLGILVALGRPFGTLAATRVKVLFVSAEDDKAELLRRVARICRALGIEQSELSGWLALLDISEVDPVMFKVLPDGTHYPVKLLIGVADFVVKNDIGLTVIDNASDVFDGNEIVRSQVRAFIRMLRQHLARPARAVILLAHVSKVAAISKGTKFANDEDYSGSTAWHNSVRSRLSLDTDDKGTSTLKHLKANKGPKAGPVALVWHSGAPEVEGGERSLAAEAAQSVLAAASAMRDAETKVLLLNIIKDFDRRGERMPTATQGGHLFVPC